MKKTKYLIYLLFFAFFLRLIFLFPQYSGDVKNHLVWGNAFLTNSTGVYSRHFPGFNDINYPPLAIYLFALSNLLLSGLNSIFSYLNQTFSFFPSFIIPLFKTENMAMGFLKLPGILSDIGIGLLIFQITRFLKYPKPLLLSAFYLLNPAIIYVSSVWGQIEPVTNFFLILSLFLSLVPQSNNKKLLSIPVFCLAILIKQTAFWFIPFYLFLWAKEIKWQGIVKGFISAVVIFFVSYFPVGLNPLLAIKSYLSTLSGSSTGVSDHAWNLWYYLFPSLPEDTFMVGLISIRTLSIIILLLFLSLFIFLLLKKYSIKKLLLFLFFWSLLVFFLQTRVHERHLAPGLVFGLLIFIENPVWWLGYLSLSLYHFLNLFITLKISFI